MDACTSMVQTDDGGFALFGFAYSFGTDAWLVKTDAYGNMEWNKTIGGGAAASFIQTLDGGFALSGAKGSFETGDYDFWLIKTDAPDIQKFPSWIILPLFLIIITLVSVILRKIATRKT